MQPSGDLAFCGPSMTDRRETTQQKPVLAPSEQELRSVLSLRDRQVLKFHVLFFILNNHNLDIPKWLSVCRTGLFVAILLMMTGSRLGDGAGGMGCLPVAVWWRKVQVSIDSGAVGSGCAERRCYLPGPSAALAGEAEMIPRLPS